MKLYYPLEHQVKTFVSIPKRGLEAMKPPALEKYTVFDFQGAFPRVLTIVADLDNFGRI